VIAKVVREVSFIRGLKVRPTYIFDQKGRD
jgi:hypothetical protein